MEARIALDSLEQTVNRADPDASGREALRKAQEYLLSIQHEDGHWCGELEGDTILETEWALCMLYLGRMGEPKVAKAGHYIRSKQTPDGGWSIYPGGPTDVSASVKAYFVLKLLGDRPHEPHMERAREAILEAGGLDACNSFTKIYLSIFGQHEWEKCPTVPPELILLPSWFYINVYDMSSWSRGIFIPLSIVSALRPSCEVPDGCGIEELRGPRSRTPTASTLGTMFLALDRALKAAEKLPIRRLREKALQKAEDWILHHLAGSDGIGAIFPPIVNTIYALHVLGYPLDDPAVQSQVRELEKLEIEEADSLRVQPCFSPVWDTALSVNALAESGLPRDHEALTAAARWLLDKRGNNSGDWKVRNPDAQAAGWFFEYANPLYPDCDTTSQVVTTLPKLDPADPEVAARCQRAVFESHRWHLTMQNEDGGWGAFDRECDKEILTHVPFADHNAMLDPSTADLTARALESLAGLGFDREYPPARRAVEFLRREQEDDGSWFGRWGCNYLYGTWLAVWGLVAIGEDPSEPWGRLAADWLRGCQNEDGGWGETLASYEDPGLKGSGPSTASQTAWALLGLIAVGERDSEPVRRGVEYLVREQSADGAWSEELWTGTGFPKVFYLRYHLYPVYFPLFALGEYLKPHPGPTRTRRRAGAATTTLRMAEVSTS